jgi:hypothetical protein
MSTVKLNAAMNVLGGVLEYNKNRITHANDVAQQAVNNAVTEQQGSLALNSLATESALARRKLGFEFLKAQKAALQREGSASVQAAWAGITGGTAHDVMTSVMQESAQIEVERDEGLKAIHDQTINRTADIIATTSNNLDHRNFSKPDVLASILGIGKDILADNRRAGVI